MKLYSGDFVGDTFYKVRQVSTGLYRKETSKSSRWAENGKIWRSMSGVLASAQHCPGPASDVEVVEFQAVEIVTHLHYLYFDTSSRFTAPEREQDGTVGG